MLMQVYTTDMLSLKPNTHGLSLDLKQAVRKQRVTPIMLASFTRLLVSITYTPPNKWAS